MRDILIIVDMQKDFIDGSLGTPEAEAILPRLADRLRSFDGEVIYTRDTHEADYLSTLEGRHLPVPHCIRGTAGWEIDPRLTALRTGPVIDKPTFGSTRLADLLAESHQAAPIDRITLVGLCTDICVLSNALLIKAAIPGVEIYVDAACCAGVTPESHANALRAMQMCQIQVENF